MFTVVQNKKISLFDSSYKWRLCANHIPNILIEKWQIFTDIYIQSEFFNTDPFPCDLNI